MILEEITDQKAIWQAHRNKQIMGQIINTSTEDFTKKLSQLNKMMENMSYQYRKQLEFPKKDFE